MMYSYQFFSEDYLSHEGRDHLSSKSGRGSGRYPWGSGKNPRQNTKADMRKAKRTQRQADKIKARRAKKEKEAAEEARKQEEAKYQAITSGDAATVKKYAHMMSNEEIEYAINRVNKMKKLSELSPQETDKLKAAEDRITEIMKHVDTVSGWTKSLNNAYTQANNLVKNVNDVKAGKFGKTTKESKDDKKDKK